MKSRTFFRFALPLAAVITMAAQTKESVPATPNESRKSELAFLNLESLATVLRHAANHTGNDAAAAQPVPSSAISDDRQKYVALYRALTKLHATRDSYIEALRLYINGVRQHLPLDQRHAALADQVRALRINLDALSAAFEPLRLSLDYRAPEVSTLIDDYTISRQAKAVSLGVFDTLTLAELTQLQAQAIHNGQTLDAGIKALLKFVTAKYPDIDKSL